jgi:hypothetical protein|tara:strand:- start:601 stop:882 length:282 start_codon:yes stop_codon:yes gene_type:complete
MANDVKVLKLINGEEIITRLEESSDGFLILEEPRVIQQMPPNASGQVGIGFVPWSICAKLDKVILDNKHVMVILEPKRDMETNYLSGITGLSL